MYVIFMIIGIVGYFTIPTVASWIVSAGGMSVSYTHLDVYKRQVLQDLKNVVNITGMSLTDAERLAIIDNAYRSLLNYRNLVNYYTRKLL